MAWVRCSILAICPSVLLRPSSDQICLILMHGWHQGQRPEQGEPGRFTPHPTPLQISSIPFLDKRGRWGLIRGRGKGTELTARAPCFGYCARPFMCMVSLDVTKELVRIVTCISEKRKTRFREVDDTCPRW